MCLSISNTGFFPRLPVIWQIAFLKLCNWFTSFTCLKPKIIHIKKVLCFWHDGMCTSINGIPVFYGMPVFYGIPVSWYWNSNSISIPVQTKYLHINLILVYHPALLGWSLNVQTSKQICYKWFTRGIIDLYMWLFSI